MQASDVSWNASVQLRRVAWLAHAGSVEIKFDRLAQVVKAGFNPDQPRVPAGTPEGGQWTGTGGGGGGTTDPNRLPTGGSIEIPEERPASARLRNAIIKQVAQHAARLLLEDELGGPVGPILNTLDVASWVIEEGGPFIEAYADPPKSLEELQDAVSTPAAGYEIHHIVEQTPAERDGFSRSLIDSPDNLVQIPTLKHGQITAWYMIKRDAYGGVSPRTYLRGKDWAERTRIGYRALIENGVLKP